jgi:hypothetical protein
MANEANPGSPSVKARILGCFVAFAPPFLLYMLADDMARGAGYDGFAAVGIASLGAVAGALVSGVVAYFVFGRKRQA